MTFASLIRTLEKLARIPSRMSGGVADRITARLKGQFAAGTDPYGTSWEPLAASTIRKKGHDTILVETGATEAGTYAAPMPGAGVALHAGPNAHWHQEGSPKFRPVLPAEGMPASWSADIKAEFQAQLAEARRG